MPNLNSKNQVVKTLLSSVLILVLVLVIWVLFIWVLIWLFFLVFEIFLLHFSSIELFIKLKHVLLNYIGLICSILTFAGVKMCYAGSMYVLCWVSVIYEPHKYQYKNNVHILSSINWSVIM